MYVYTSTIYRQFSCYCLIFILYMLYKRLSNCQKLCTKHRRVRGASIDVLVVFFLISLLTGNTKKGNSKNVFVFKTLPATVCVCVCVLVTGDDTTRAKQEKKNVEKQRNKQEIVIETIKNCSACRVNGKRIRTTHTQTSTPTHTHTHARIHTDRLTSNSLLHLYNCFCCCFLLCFYCSVLFCIRFDILFFFCGFC